MSMQIFRGKLTELLHTTGYSAMPASQNGAFTYQCIICHIILSLQNCPMIKDDGNKVCFYGQIILTIFGFVMKGKLIEQNRK